MKKLLLILFTLLFFSNAQAHNPILGQHDVYGDIYATGDIYGLAGIFTSTLTIGGTVSQVLFTPTGELITSEASADGYIKMKSDGTTPLSLWFGLDGTATSGHSEILGFNSGFTPTPIDIRPVGILQFENDETITNTVDGIIAYGGGIDHEFDYTLLAQFGTHNTPASDHTVTIAVNGQFGAVVTLPTVIEGQMFYVKNVGNGSTQKSFQLEGILGTELVDGDTSLSIPAGTSILVQSDGTDWIKIFRNDKPAVAKFDGNSTLTSVDLYVSVDTATITLSPSPVDGQLHTIKAHGGTSYVDPEGADTIDGSASQRTLLDDETLSVVYSSTRTTWLIIDEYSPDNGGGLSATYTFGGGATDDIATMTFTDGILTAVTTVP